MRFLLVVALFVGATYLVWAMFRFGADEWVRGTQMAGGTATVLAVAGGFVVYLWRKAVRTDGLPSAIRLRSSASVFSVRAKVDGG